MSTRPQPQAVFISALVLAWVLGLGLCLSRPRPPAFQLRQEPRRIEDLQLVLLPVPAGSFILGSTTGQLEEEPLTGVSLSPFWLAQTELTQAQWCALMGPNPSLNKGPQLPVENLSFADALAFCQRLTERERLAGRLPQDYEYTLPTEAQWEHACRAGRKPSPEGPGEEDAWTRENSGLHSHPVGRKRPNAWGFYDLQGNVWEWCLDKAEDYPGGAHRDYLCDKPAGPRVRRGGSFLAPRLFCRSTYRYARNPRAPLECIGLRVALCRLR